LKLDLISFATPMPLLAIALAVTIGGILKGATGAGAPVLAVPVIAAFYDVRVAVAVMVLPSLMTNLVQMKKYRAHRIAPGFARNMAVGGALGAAVGTILLVQVSISALKATMAALIVMYILLRFARPNLKLSISVGRLCAMPAGFLAGVLQGAVGISAPVSLTFLNAMRLERDAFIFTVSVFFASMSATQFVAQVHFGIMTLEMALLGLVALIPLVGAMPIGHWLGRRFDARTFDVAILAFLGVLAMRLIWTEIALF
jgi:uncharacterized membrane protein YfcA